MAMILSETSGVVVLKPQGHLNAQGSTTLQECIDRLSPEPQRLWVLDLDQIEFIDSFGLMALTESLKAARACGSRLVICNLRAPVRLILEITQLDRVFEIFESPEAALKQHRPRVITPLKGELAA